MNQQSCPGRYRLLPVLACLYLSSDLPAQSVRATTVYLRPHSWPMLIVPVEINGRGPYDFVLDTGSTVTILEGSLARELDLRPEGDAPLIGPAASSAQPRATAREMKVNGLGVVNLRVAVMESLNLGPLTHQARGILGENFLDRFDLLIDNQNRQVRFDATAGLADSLDGEHLRITPMSYFQGSVLPHRPIVSVTVPSYNSHPLRLLLDTASSGLAIFPHQAAVVRALNGGNATPIQVTTPNGNLSCAAWKDKVRWGNLVVSGVDVLSCPGVTAENVGNEGSLPTYIFQRILIIHSGMYVVVNPVHRDLTPVQEAAQLPEPR